MMASVPACAPPTPPDTGASMKRCPRAVQQGVEGLRFVLARRTHVDPQRIGTQRIDCRLDHAADRIAGRQHRYHHGGIGHRMRQNIVRVGAGCGQHTRLAGGAVPCRYCVPGGQ